ncbi:hypothetical protein [Galactobacter valiniphilus]|uniref:hypothetical protein n=1 Tax=Galactobacter valiniphilus TaxID=2676122 RepID=UPI003735368E
MRAFRPLLALSLPLALALSACTGSTAPAPSTGIDVGTAASSHSTGPSGASTAASSPAPSTTASGTSQPRLAWGDGTAVTWGKPAKPVQSTPADQGSVDPVVKGATPIPWAFVGEEVLSSQEPDGSFDGGTGTFKEFPSLVLGERALATSKGVDGAEPGQVLAAVANEDWVVWAESPSAEAGPSPWTLYKAKRDGSAVTKVFGSDDVGEEPFSSTRLVLARDHVAFTIGSVEGRHVVTSALDGTQQSLIPAPGASEVWAGTDDTILWETREDGQIKLMRAVVDDAMPATQEAVLTVPARASGEELAPLRLLAASGQQALIATGDKVAAVDLYAKTVREVASIDPSSIDPSGAGAGDGRVTVHVDGSSRPGTHVLSIAPNGTVQLLTLPATEGVPAVGADLIAVTTVDGDLTVVAVD